MKELSNEDKAKRYDEALQRATKWYDANTNEGYRGIFEEIFPELKEESEGERIRKALIKYYSFDKDGGSHALDNITPKQILAWLEKQGESDETKAKMFLINKGYPIDTNGTFPIYEEMYDIIKEGLEKQGEQKPVIEMKTPEESLGIDSNTYNKIVDECIYGEQKPADVEEISFFEDFRKTDSEVEPKFKVEKDKWYVCISQYCNCIEGRNYKASLDGRIIDDYGTEYDMHDDAYRWFRPWTIQDVKDGDVLVTRKSQPFIFKKYDEDTDYVYAYCGICDLVKDNSFYTDDDQLWTCYSVAGDVYPATKEQHDLLFQKMKEAGYEWNAEKKELKEIIEEVNGEDYGIDGLYHAQRILEKTLGKVDGYQSSDGLLDHKAAITAVKKLYEQKSAEWSEEDESIVLGIEQLCNCASLLNIAPDKIDKIRTWLKSIRPQNKYAYNPYKAVVESIAAMVEKYASFDSNLQDFYDNVKVKCKDAKEYDSLYPQSTWKPSDEQMKAFDAVLVYNPPCSNECRNHLITLYNDLKKLREE